MYFYPVPSHFISFCSTLVSSTNPIIALDSEPKGPSIDRSNYQLYVINKPSMYELNKVHHMKGEDRYIHKKTMHPWMASFEKIPDTIKEFEGP